MYKWRNSDSITENICLDCVQSISVNNWTYKKQKIILFNKDS